MAAGIVTATGPAITHAGVTVPIPAARTPVGAWIAATVAAIDAGEIAPCPHCGKWAGCDCVDWLEWMLPADPHDDLSVWLEGEIPF